MDAKLLYSCPVHQWPPLNPLSSKLKRGKLLFSGIEVADGPWLFASRSNHRPFSAPPTIKVDVEIRGKKHQGSLSPENAPEEEWKRTLQFSDGNAASREKREQIISLFKRIQTSIAEKGASSKKTSPKVSGDDKRITRRRSPVKKGKKEQKADDPPSLIVKESSPISSSHPTEEPEVPTTSEATSATNNGELELEPQKVKAMKLLELKELAKSKGIRGYSKMKKIELLELLTSF